MPNNEIPNFPRGFILSTKQVEPPPSFTAGPLLPNFYIHPRASVDFSGDGEGFVISIGHLVATHAEDTGRPTALLLEALRHGEGEFFRTLSTFGGRHAVIFGNIGNISVVNDATSMRSVFYAAEGQFVASHPLLIERALGGKVEKDNLPFRYGYPGNRTPYPRTKILTPNTCYWLTAHVVRRFWPIISPSPQSVEYAAASLLDLASNALRIIAQDRTVRLTLTAGLDSRTIFALALHSGITFSTYTYGGDETTRVDREVARDLSIKHGVPHTIIPTPIKDRAFDKALDQSLYRPLHHAPWIRSLSDFYDDTESVALLGNLLEIGRSNSSNERRIGLEAPINAKTMANLHFHRMGRARQDEVRTYGFSIFQNCAEASFQEFIDDTGFTSQIGFLDPFDQFYWEHRMATWQGVAMGERDFYAVPFIPYNSRNIFEILLGVEKTKRHNNETIHEMIRQIDSELLEIPINPKRWPL